MSQKKKIIIVLLIVCLFVIFKIMEYNHLFPSQIGMIIVNDGASATTVPIQEESQSSEAEGLTEKETSLEEESSSERASSSTKDSASAKGATSADLSKNTEQDSENSTTTAAGKGDVKMFYVTELTKEIKERITGISYADHCTIPYEDLRYIQVLYWGFDKETHTGELIVNKAIAEDILDIFKELYEAKYPLERMVLIDEYEANDNASMAANNSSAFCFRVIDNGSNRLSNHSYGLAIDINPLYNPYVREIDGKITVSPEEGAEYVDRSLDCNYYIKKGDVCYQAFISRGFTWGGDWKNQKDYQHFQKVLD